MVIGTLTLLQSAAEGMVQLGFLLLVQSTLLIGLGLLWGRLAQPRGAAVKSVIYRMTLAGTFAVPLISFMMASTGMSIRSLDFTAVWARVVPLEQAKAKPGEVSQHQRSPLQNEQVQSNVLTSEQRIRQDDVPVPPSNFSQSTVTPTVSVSPTRDTLNTKSVPEQPEMLFNTRLFSLVLAIVWFCASCWLFTRVGMAYYRLVKLRRSAIDVSVASNEMCHELALILNVTAPPVRQTPFIASPCLVGWRHPMILLPEEIEGKLLRVVLIHELAHLRRRDSDWNLLRHLATSVMFFQPLLWWLSSCIEESADEVCDDFVLQLAGEREFYASRLADYAERCLPAVPTLSTGMVSLRSSLARRMTRIMDSSRQLSTQLSMPLWIACLTCGIAIILSVGLIGTATIGLAAQNSEQPPAKSPSRETASSKANGASPGVPESNATTEETAEKVGKITGTVVLKSDGTPIANADVCLLRRQLHIGVLPIIRVKTDAQGQFEFPDLKPGPYRVWAFHDDLISRSKMLKGLQVDVDIEGVASVTPKLELWPGNRVKVHVISNVTQQPLENARVRLLWTDTDRDHFTDAHGNVEILGLTSERWHFEAAAAGHAVEARQLVLNAQQLQTEVTFALNAGGELSGRVIDSLGQPLADVGISVFPGNHRGPQIEYVETDTDGRYAFHYLPLSDLEVSFSKNDWVAERRSVVLNSDDRTKTLNMTLQQRLASGSIHVTVRNEMGEPLEKVTIQNHGRSSNDMKTGTTNDQGQCLLENLFRNNNGYEIVVRAPGYAPLKVNCEPGKETPTEISIVLQRGHSLKGRVLLSDGSPAAGQWVFFAHGESTYGGFGDKATTDKDGRFSFNSLPKPCTFTFYAPSGYSKRQDLDLPLDGDDEVEVRLEPAAAVRGRVVDADTGEPVPVFNVKLGFCQRPQPGDTRPMSMGSDLSKPGSDFSGPTGNFVINDLVDLAPYQMTIEAPQYEREVIERVIASRSEDDIPEFKLTRVDPKNYQEVSGRVQSADGTPLAGIIVKLLVSKELRAKWSRFPLNWQMVENGQIEQFSGCLQFLSVVTDSQGIFRFPMVKRDAELDLFYWGGTMAPGMVRKLAETHDNLNDIVVVAVPAAKLEIHFDRMVFSDATHLTISSEMFGSRSLSLPEKDNTFTVDPLGTAIYRVALQGKMTRHNDNGFTLTTLATKTVELRDGETQQIDFKPEDRIAE